jgi:hypothetical protein
MAYLRVGSVKGRERERERENNEQENAKYGSLGTMWKETQGITTRRQGSFGTTENNAQTNDETMSNMCT